MNSYISSDTLWLINSVNIDIDLNWSKRDDDNTILPRNFPCMPITYVVVSHKASCYIIISNIAYLILWYDLKTWTHNILNESTSLGLCSPKYIRRICPFNICCHLDPLFYVRDKHDILEICKYLCMVSASAALKHGSSVQK